MNVWFYYIDNDDSTGINNVMFFNFYPANHTLSVKYYDGTKEIFKNVDYISNVYDSNMDKTQHEILLF